VRSSFTVHTPADSHLELYPNSGQMYTYEGVPILDQQNLNLGNSTFTLGDLDACFEWSVFLSFKFKVVKNITPVNPTLSIDKQVRNLTSGNAFADSTNAVQNDRVQYQIKVKNNGPTVATQVALTDNGVAGIGIEPNILNATGSPISGIFPGTVNIGDMQPGEERTYFYSARVLNASGVFVNTATAKATNTPAVSDTATVNVQTVVKFGALSINKLVKNDTLGSSYVDTVDARTGDRVTFQVTVTNPSATAVQNVTMTDTLPDGLSLDTGSVRVDGVATSGLINVVLGTLNPGQTKTITFTTQVLALGPVTLRNVAVARGTSVADVSDDAFVRVIVISKPGIPNIVLSKRAFNDTKNVDATTVNASREDFITYSLVTTNTGTADSVNYVISDDLSQVLPFADMVERNGGTLNGNTISYPAVTIRPGETVVKTFKVRVKASLQPNLSFQMRNTYGNTIVINIPGKTVFEAPKTGAAGTSAAVFAGLFTSGFVIFRKRAALLKLILA
jgi:uncharacterized repeat protein (TIGR01451 family)/fimbrial isopeptide formation D2 family protein